MTNLPIEPRPRVFSFHYNKRVRQMSVHWHGKCHIVNNIECRVPCTSKWNKRQPNVVMRGYARNFTVIADGFVTTGIIE